MPLPERHDQLILGSEKPLEEQVNVEVVAIDEAKRLFTCYSADEDALYVLYINEDGHFAQVQFERTKEPWEA